MAPLDTLLVSEAWKYVTGTNRRRIKQLICCYEGAVRECATGRTYRRDFEDALRDFVLNSRRNERMQTHLRVLREHSYALNLRSIAINAKIDQFFGKRSA